VAHKIIDEDVWPIVVESTSGSKSSRDIGFLTDRFAIAIANPDSDAEGFWQPFLFWGSGIAYSVKQEYSKYF
jgi:hypothetical protein